MLIDRRGRRLIKVDEARKIFAIIWNDATSGRVRQPRRGNRGQKRDDVSLPVAAGFFQHAAHMREDRIARDAAIRSDVFHGFAGGESAGDARLAGLAALSRESRPARRRSGQKYRAPTSGWQ
jgi:hypothetical protein